MTRRNGCITNEKIASHSIPLITFEIYDETFGIAENLESALEQFRGIYEDLEEENH